MQQKTKDETENLGRNVKNTEQTKADTQNKLAKFKGEISTSDEANEILDRMSSVTIEKIQSINTYEGLFEVITALKSDLKRLKKGKKHGLQDS